MQLPAFETMVRAMAAEVPADYFDGITEVTVSPRVVSHPTRDDIFTLGECIPLGAEAGDAAATQSRVVLYHGSFRALAELDDEFDWEAETWDTLVHELRHHVEWRAQDGSLEAYDGAADANFARHEGGMFEPLFFLGGELIEADVYRVDDDVFIDQVVPTMPSRLDLSWNGREYQVDVPRDTTFPAYLAVSGVDDPPPGELVMVVRRKARFADLFTIRAPCQLAVRAARVAPRDAR